MKFPLIAVFLSAVVIAGVCAWRLTNNQPQDYSSQLEAATVDRPAPDFEALDANNQMFRLSRYLGRHRILVIFFNAELSARNDPNLRMVFEFFDQLRSQDVQIVGISTALPQHNRAALADREDFNIPLVTDLDLKIHDRWGRLNRETGEPLSGVFLVDRKGDVPCFGLTPQPIDDLRGTLESLVSQ